MCPCARVLTGLRVFRLTLWEILWTASDYMVLIDLMVKPKRKPTD